jgi:hypothetical protein
LRSGPRGFRPGFPCPAVLRNLSRKAMRFRLRGRCPLWRDVPVTSANARLCNFPTRRQTDQDRPYNTRVTTTAVLTSHRFGLFPFRSPLLRESRFLSFPPVTKMFQFTGLPPTCPMYSGMGTRALPRAGFPIRISRDQRLVSTYSGLFAAAHVLLRLLAPRHPPCALSLLIVKNTLNVAMEFSRCARIRCASLRKAGP